MAVPDAIEGTGRIGMTDAAHGRFGEVGLVHRHDRSNGQIVIRTGLPSFIVTLAFLFILRGLSLVRLKRLTGGSTQLRGVRGSIEDDFLTSLFSGDAIPGPSRSTSAT